MSEGGATQGGQAGPPATRSTVLLKMPEIAEILNVSTARCYEMTLPMVGTLSRTKVEARAEAELRSLSGYVARVIVKDLGG